MIHPEGDLTVDVLLGILRTDRFSDPSKTTEVAVGGGADHTLVESHQVTGQGPATGVASATDPLRVQRLPGFRQQVTRHHLSWSRTVDVIEYLKVIGSCGASNGQQK